jgi:hypothetical protein
MARLREWARQRGDEPFHLALYRRSAPRRQWLQEMEQLCNTIAEPEKLCAALEARQSEIHRLTFHNVLHLLRQRGADVLPYVRQFFGHVVSDWPVSHYAPLLGLADESGWLDLWAGLILRHSWPWDYQRILQRTLADPDMPEPEVRQRVLLLCGVSCDGFQALRYTRRRFLWDGTAVALYRRFPDLLTGALRSRLRRGGVYRRLTAAAREAGDATLWGELVRSRSTEWHYENNLLSLINDPALKDTDLQPKLLAQLAGIAGEWSARGVGLTYVRPLTDKTALALYRRQPALLRGVFRKHVIAGYQQPYPLLTAAALDAGDADLIDFLASRLITRPWLGWLVAGPMKGVVEKLARYYEELVGRPDEFVRRSVELLGQIPAYSINQQEYNKLIRNNRLARLLFERSAAVYLEHPLLLRDLLEAPEIHVQVLALRALGLEDRRVQPIAVDNLDLLLPTLLRPLHRRTRLLAFRAIFNAATNEENARLILRRAREALDLPAQRYPREALIGLIGRLLARWPALRGANEQPRIFAEKVS